MARSRSAPALVALLSLLPIALPLLAPSAAAGVGFLSDFESGLGGWNVATNAGTLSQDCTTGFPGCSAKFQVACCSRYLSMTQDMSVPVSGATTFSFALRASRTGGDTDSDIQLSFNNGDGIILSPTDGGNTCITIGTFKRGWVQHNFGCWNAAYTWFRVDVTFDTTASSYVARLYGPTGNLMGTSSTITFNAGVTSVTKMWFSTVFWGGGYMDMWYDAIKISSPDTLPGVPRNVAAVGGGHQIALSWTAPATGDAPTGYEIYRSASGLFGPLPYRSVGNVLSFADTGLGDAETWYYKIAAKNGAGLGPASAVVSATTISPPPRPVNVRTASHANAIAVHWDEPQTAQPIDEYVIYRGFRSAAMRERAVVDRNDYFGTTSFLDGTALFSYRYWYDVTSRNGAGESPRGTPLCATVRDGLIPCDFSRTWLVGTLGGAPSATENTYGLTVADDDFRRWKSPGQTVTFEVDMGDMANKNELVEFSPYWMKLNAYVRASRSVHSFATSGPINVAEVYVNDKIAGVVSATSAAPFDDYYYLSLENEIAIPQSALHEGKNTVRIVPLSMAGAGDGRWLDGWQVWVEAAQVELVARPVVITHGFSRSGTISEFGVEEWQNDMLDFMVADARSRWLQNPWDWAGYVEFEGAPRSLGFRLHAYNPTAGFRLSAVDLHDGIAIHRDGLGWKGKVDIVAHSMGGLVSRWFIEEGVYEPSSQRMSYGSEVIEKLMMVGTPNMGSGWALALASALDKKFVLPGFHFYYGVDGHPVCGLLEIEGPCVLPWDWRNWWEPEISAFRHGDDWNYESHFNLWPQEHNPVLRTLNEKVPSTGVWTGPEGVRYHVIAGYGEITHGDFVVSRESACMEGRLPCTSIVGFSAGGEAFHNSLYEHPQVIEHALTFLASPAGTPIGDAALEVAIEAEAPLSRTPTRHGILGAGASAMASLPLDESLERVAFYVVVSGEDAADADVHMVGPDGTIYREAETQEAGGEWSSWSFGEGNAKLVSFILPAPPGGAWRARVVNAEGASNLSWIAWGEFPSAIHAESIVPVGASLPGVPVPILVRVADGDAPVLGADVAASYRLPNKLKVTLALADDGLHGDGSADDGLYGAYYVGLERGLNGFEIHVEGDSLAGAAFARDIETSIWIEVPPPATCAANLASSQEPSADDARRLLACAYEFRARVHETAEGTLAAAQAAAANPPTPPDGPPTPPGLPPLPETPALPVPELPALPVPELPTLPELELPGTPELPPLPA